MPVRDVSMELLQLFCELLASTGKIPQGYDARGPLIRRLSKIRPNLLAWLFGKRFCLRPFIDSIEPKRIFPGTGPPYKVLRRRWRFLRKRLVSDPGAACSLTTDQGLDATLSDLQFVSKAGRRPWSVESQWRTHGKAVLSKTAAVRGKPVQPLSRLYWEGARSRKLAFWEKLIGAQAGELSEVRRLAGEVSRQTGRVVLSWHNASLGAAGGWAFEDIAAWFACPELYGRFVQAVRDRVVQIRNSFDFSSAMDLFELRSKRIFAPKMARAAEHSQICALFESPCSGLSGPGIRDKYEWPGALSPHQSLSPEQVRAWMDKAREGWVDGLILLFALAGQGQSMLDSGRIASFVLPWIDKFFISSRRRADGIYLGKLFRFVSAYIEEPLILFWEDTAHREAPSLGLALEDQAAGGLPVEGIGIFGAGVPAGGSYESERAGAVRIIVNDYPGKALFALRPLNENHCPDAFRRVFKNLDMRFFLNYDSSWKDNLAFIYAGTQVFPLLSGQTEMECVSPWVCARGERFAFGAWFRRMLRHISLGEPEGVSSPLCLEYSSWANLL